MPDEPWNWDPEHVPPPEGYKTEVPEGIGCLWVFILVLLVTTVF